jgi:hypothetical protein
VFIIYTFVAKNWDSCMMEISKCLMFFTWKWLGFISLHSFTFLQIWNEFWNTFLAHSHFLCLNLVHKFKIMVITHIVQVRSFYFQNFFHLNFKMLVWMYSIQINVVLKGKHLISPPCTIFYFSIGFHKTIPPFLNSTW